MNNTTNKSKFVALLLCLFFGYFGLHRFYLDKKKSAKVWLCTLGLFGIGWVIDTIALTLDVLSEFKRKPISQGTTSQISTGNISQGATNTLNSVDPLNNSATQNSFNTLTTTSPNEDIEHFSFKVAGVTFKNGRKYRQTILRKIYWGDEPYDSFVHYHLNKYDFEGELAIGVYVNDEQIGNVPRDKIPYVLSNWDRIISTTAIVYGGNLKEDGTRTNYGAEITLTLSKKS